LIAGNDPRFTGPGLERTMSVTGSGWSELNGAGCLLLAAFPRYHHFETISQIKHQALAIVAAIGLQLPYVVVIKIDQ
jgi:hypothetical protein